MSKKITSALPSTELDPLFVDVIDPYFSRGNVTAEEMQERVERYVDSRIEKYFKTSVGNGADTA